MAFAFNPLDVQGITGPGGPTGPISRSVVQALLAKHGAKTPFIPKPNGGAMSVGSEAGPSIKAPGDLSGVIENLPTVAPQASIGDGGKAMADVASSAPTDLKKPGLFDRIGDFLHSDEGRAALLRSGAATLRGGLGAGIEAGAGFVDQRRHELEASAASADERAMRQKQIDNAFNLGLGHLDIDAQNSGETARANRAREGNDQYRVQADVYKHKTPSADKQLDVGERRFEHINPSGNTVVNEQGANYRHDSVSGDTAATQAGEDRRNTQDNQTQIMRDRIARAPTITTHAHYTTTPEEYAKNGPRLRPSQVQPTSGGATKIASDEEYNALPSGTRFVGPDGQIRVKP